MPDLPGVQRHRQRQPFKGPEARKWRKAWEKEQSRKSESERASEERSAEMAVRSLMAQVTEVERSGVVVDEEDESPINRPGSTPTKPPGWYRDPGGRFDYRFFNGVWTDDVANDGDDQTYTDPVSPR